MIGDCRRGLVINETGLKIYYSKGRKDNWLVNYETVDGAVTHPIDKNYFRWTLELASQYGKDNVWDSFNSIYYSVKKNRWMNEDRELCKRACIKEASKYDEPTLKLWITYYMTMLAEENMPRAILGKRIKRLGVYNILWDEYTLDYVCSYMRDMGWMELAELMKKRDIYDY